MCIRDSHQEGVDLMPANIELSAMEMSLVNAMSREFTLRTYVNEVKKNYDTCLLYTSFPSGIRR